MLSIAICDDEIQITGKIENLVRKNSKQKFCRCRDGSFLEWRVVTGCYYKGQ